MASSPKIQIASRAVVLASLVSLLWGCQGPIDAQLTGVCDDLSKAESAYFQDTVLPEVLDKHCTLCHSVGLPAGQGIDTRRGAPRYLNYNVYEGATLDPGSTWTRVADRTMPPMGRELDTYETDLLYDWLNCVAAHQLLGDDDDSSGDDDDSGR